VGVMLRLGIGLVVLMASGCERMHPPGGEYAASHPQLVAFVQPELAASNLPGSSEALAELELALSDTVRCLEMDELGVSVIYQPKVDVRYADATHSFGFEDEEAQDAVVGVVLIAPGRPPMGVYSGMGASFFQQRLRDAAAGYFGKEQCRLER
jgi:hypothetical protein